MKKTKLVAIVLFCLLLAPFWKLVLAILVLLGLLKILRAKPTYK